MEAIVIDPQTSNEDKVSDELKDTMTLRSGRKLPTADISKEEEMKERNLSLDKLTMAVECLILNQEETNKKMEALLRIINAKMDEGTREKERQQTYQASSNQSPEKEERAMVNQGWMRSDAMPKIHIQIFRGEIGENPIEHIETLREFLRFYPMQKEHQLPMATHHLKGYAKCWWNGVKGKISDLAQYTHCLQQTFWSEERQEGIHQRISNEIYGNTQETHTQFFMRQVDDVRQLTAFHFTEPQVIRMVQANMPADVQRTMMISRISKVDEMISLLTAVDYAPPTKPYPTYSQYRDRNNGTGQEARAGNRRMIRETDREERPVDNRKRFQFEQGINRPRGRDA